MLLAWRRKSLSSSKIRFGIVGLGAIGAEVLKYMLERGHTLVFAVDSDKNKAGKYIDQIFGTGPRILISSEPNTDNLNNAELAIICTSSRLRSIYQLVHFFSSAGVDVVSTCEELAYPWLSEPEISEELNKLAIQNKSRIVGAGVNPGFIMDLLPSVVALASKRPKKIHVTRSVDVSRRRSQLRSKLGIGMSKGSVERGLKEGTLGHVGLRESICIIAYSMGMEVKNLSYNYELITGSDNYVIGVRQFSEGDAGECRLRLDLEMSLTSADFDLIEVEGEPRLKVRFEGGVFGDTATVAMVANISERIKHARPGLITVLDVPLAKAPQTNAFRSS
jgi:4-hydroxy-tetrahydrodipicolinate reductase